MHKPKGIILFGGTFDPIHHGHLIIARSAAEILAVAKVIIIPAAQPPHKEAANLSDPQHRLAMTKLAVQNDPLFDVSDCELLRAGPSYTLDTVRHFRTLYPQPTPLYWLIGTDSIAELPLWYRVNQLVEQCTIITAARPGHNLDDFTPLQNVIGQKQTARLKQHLLDTPHIEISATNIRRRAARGLALRYLLPSNVADYLHTHNLYQTP